MTSGNNRQYIGDEFHGSTELFQRGCLVDPQAAGTKTDEAKELEKICNGNLLLFNQYGPNSSATYTSSDIEKLLAKSLTDGNQAKLLPTYFPDTPSNSITHQQFEGSLANLLINSLQQGTRILIPLCFEKLVNSQKQNLWVLLLVVVDKVEKNAAIVYIDPRGNGRDDQKPQLVDINIEYQHQDAGKKALINRMLKIFQQARVLIKQFALTGTRQITEQQLTESGPILILNAQCLLSLKPINPNPLNDIAIIYAQQQEVLLKSKSTSLTL
jgi:hypothetical protein